MPIIIDAGANAGGEYIGEILRTWGLHDVAREVWIIPAGEKVNAQAVEARARDGAVVISILPDEAVAKLAGVTIVGERELPAQLRMTAFMPRGLQGEMIPIVGNAQQFTIGDKQPLAWLCERTTFDSESPAIVDTPIGSGRLIALAFDLPRCVMMLRQGDPDRKGYVPEGDGAERPSHMACEIESAEAGWCPYADLLARLLVELIERNVNHPTPLLHHLPGDMPSVLLYSGDEDAAPVSNTNDQMTELTARRGRMDLYIIPDWTYSSADDLARYAKHHDLGPHPNLRPCDGKPIAEKLARLEQQINDFKKLTGIEPLTLRNHCTAWAGYMQHIEVLERCGLRMETSYFSSDYMRGRRYAPYNSFGGAMPMRFAHPDGTLLNVYQQHTQFADDVLFEPTQNYSYKFTAEAFAAIADRTCREAAQRFHTPVGVCIHPSNRPKFSRDADAALLDAATKHDMPIWSFTQWCKFWIAREQCAITDMRWANGTLTFNANNPTTRDDLRIALPTDGLQAVRIDDKPTSSQSLIAIRAGQHTYEADYKERNG